MVAGGQRRVERQLGRSLNGRRGDRCVLDLSASLQSSSILSTRKSLGDRQTGNSTRTRRDQNVVRVSSGERSDGRKVTPGDGRLTIPVNLAADDLCILLRLRGILLVLKDAQA